MLTDDGAIDVQGGVGVAKAMGLLALIFAVGAIGGFVGRMLWPEPR
jgi:hypothetical protein